MHGLGGHALGNFKESKTPYIWVRDQLPRDFPQLRIWTYGYDSGLDNEDSTADEFEWANRLADDVRRMRISTVDETVIALPGLTDLAHTADAPAHVYRA